MKIFLHFVQDPSLPPGDRRRLKWFCSIYNTRIINIKPFGKKRLQGPFQLVKWPREQTKKLNTNLTYLTIYRPHLRTYNWELSNVPLLLYFTLTNYVSLINVLYKTDQLFQLIQIFFFYISFCFTVFLNRGCHSPTRSRQRDFCKSIHLLMQSQGSTLWFHVFKGSPRLLLPSTYALEYLRILHT